MIKFMKEQKVKAVGLISVFFICMAILLSGMQAKATTSYSTLDLDDQWVPVTVTGGDYVYYKVTVPSAGWITVSFQVLTDGKVYTYLYDSDLVSYESYFSTSGSEDSPGTNSKTWALEAGTYYFKTIKSGGSGSCSCRIKASFTSANSNAVGGTGFDSAVSISANADITGFLTIDDTYEYYKFTLSEKEVMRISVTTYDARFGFELWDED